MSIIEFESAGNVRLAYQGITSVKMTPIQKLQMILGTNGSGKSTVMGELSPLPAKHNQYVRGGYKRTVHLHKGSTYESLSDFTEDKNHYSLTRDGINIYSGHSSEAHAAHVLTHFGITPELHDIRTGKIRLSRMETEERRKWFTKIATEDYTYAIDYFKRLSTATRNISGTIDRLNTKIMQEKSKLISVDEEAAMREEIKIEIDRKAQMMRHWRPTEDSVGSILEKVDHIDTTLEKMCQEFTYSLKSFTNARGYKSQTDIWDDISKAQGRLTYLESKISEIVDIIQDNRSLVEQARDAMGQDLEVLNAQLADVSRKVSHVNMGIFTGDDWKDIGDQALQAYESIYNPLLAVMTELIEDTNLIYTAEQHQVRAEKISELTRLIDHLNTQSRNLSEQISIADHRKLDGHTECPKCEHVWSKGFDQDAYDALKLEHEKTVSALEHATEKYEAIRETQELSSEQLNHYQQITMIARSTPILDPMWKGLVEKKFIRILPGKAIEYVKTIQREILMNKELTELKAQRDELVKSVTSAKEMSGVNQRELIAKNDGLEEQLGVFQREASELSKLVTGLQRAQKAMEYQEKYIPAVEDLMMRRDDLINKAEVANHHSAINAIVMQLDASISSKERLLNQIDNQHHLIRSLEEEVQTCTAKEKYMKQAMKTLSPATGLIAKGLTGSINHFIAQMNAIIEKVWSKSLVIKPIEIKEGSGVKLDYKFPFTIEGKDAGLDIKQSSSGQTEIFDIAFMLVSLVRCGLDDSEIFLDEFGNAMDYTHRKEAMKMIMDLLHNSSFSQIFMISHYENSYGSLTNADITVMCPENIQLSSDLKYNINSEIL